MPIRLSKSAEKKLLDAFEQALASAPVAPEDPPAGIVLSPAQRNAMLDRPRRKAKPKKLGAGSVPELPRARWYAGPVVALDVSSKVMGRALLGEGRVLDADVLKVPGTRDVFKRADWLVDRLPGLFPRVEGWAYPVVVMEYVSGMHGQATAVGVAAVAHAQGAVRQALRRWGLRVEMVAENQWTRGLGNKAKRVAATRLAVPPLAEIDDPGGDAADAAGLGLWWVARNEK
jgi:hypothetical protein